VAVLHRSIRRILSVRLSALLFMLLLIAAIAASAFPGRDVYISPQQLRQGLDAEGLRVSALPAQPAPADGFILRGISPQRFELLPGQAAEPAPPKEAISIYVFPSAAERSKGEDMLRRLILYQAGPLEPLLYRRSNVLLLYWPSAIVNQSGTPYGDQLQRALSQIR
jgi:hypothetical protein